MENAQTKIGQATYPASQVSAYALVKTGDRTAARTNEAPSSRKRRYETIDTEGRPATCLVWF